MSNHPPKPDLKAMLDRIEYACNQDGFALDIDHISRNGRTAYAWVFDEQHRFRLRVSNHRSRKYRCGPYMTRRGQIVMLWQVLTRRPPTLAHLIRHMDALALRRNDGYAHPATTGDLHD